ncbi:hypothetical protein MBLNU230_g3131t1 [Neophaeotheca triangularis]
MSGQNSIGEPTRYRDTVTGKEVWWSRSKHSYVTAARERVKRSNVQQRPQTPSTQQTEPETSQEETDDEVDSSDGPAHKLEQTTSRETTNSRGRHPPHASGRRPDDEIAPVIAAYESARRSQHESINAAVQSSSSRVRNDAPMGGRSGLTNFATELATLVSEAQRLSVRGPELTRDEQRRLAGDRTAWASYVRNLKRNWGTELASRRNNEEQSDDEESSQGSTEESSDSD